jgi:hypothetical protein
MVMATKGNSVQPHVLRLAHVHFFYILVFVATIVVHDASHYLAPGAVLSRWKVAAAMTLVVTGVWYAAHVKKKSETFYRSLVAALVFADMFFAAFVVYNERGMASPAVALFAVPIGVSAALLNRTAVLATASLCTAAYALAVDKYFVDYFNEGLKVQLYSTIAFYGAIFFILAFLLVVTIQRLNKDS